MSDDRELELAQFEAAMKHASCKLILGKIIKESGLLDRVFSSDPLQHAHSEGRRDLGVWLVNELKESNKELYYKILEECDND